MYKHVAPLVRESSRSHAEFVEHWRREYAPRAREIAGLDRYVEVVPTDPASAEFDGLAELFFADLSDLRAALGGESLPVDTVIDVESRPGFDGEVTVQRDDVGGVTDGLYKHSAFLVRQDGMTHEDFVDYWQTTHTPIARDIEGVVKYDTVLPADPASAAYDGVAELYFETLDDLHAALGSEGSRDYDPEREVAARAREDVDNFLDVDRRPRLIGREHVVRDGS